MSLDAAALQVLIARLSGVAEEMGAVLRRAAYSPNIKERADCSAAVFDASGALLAQARRPPTPPPMATCCRRAWWRTCCGLELFQSPVPSS